MLRLGRDEPCRADRHAALADLYAAHERLREENRRLRDLLAPPGYLPAVFKLTEREERAFKALLSRDQWSKEALLASIYQDHDVTDVPDAKTVDFILCKLRKKIAPYGIGIDTFWCKGYRISPAMRVRAAMVIAAALADERAEPPSQRARLARRADDGFQEV